MPASSESSDRPRQSEAVVTRSGPLAGIRIVEMDAIGPVPLAAMILGDFGCDIVRLERADAPRGLSATGPVVGRGRRHVTLDLKDSNETARALELIASADALIEGSRPGVMERLGLGPDRCLAANPRLVYGRMTGWGQEGPLSARAGHDINYIGLTGALHAIGPASGPIPPLNLVGDYGGGAMLLALGVTAALLSARVSGKGQVVDAAMVDGSALLMSIFYSLHQSGHWADERESNLLDGAAPFYRSYVCSDGRHVAVGAIEAPFFRQLVDGLGIDPSLVDQHDRARWPQLAELFATRFATNDRDTWCEQFANSDACVTPILSLKEAPRHPHNASRKTFASPAGPVQPMPAPRFSRTPATAHPSEESSFDAVLTEWQSAGRSAGIEEHRKRDKTWTSR